MQPRLTSLRLQVAGAFSLLLAGLLAVAFGAVYAEVSRGLWRELDRDLLGLAQTELSSAVDEPAEGPHLHATRAGHQAVIFTATGQILATSPGLPAALAQELVATGLSAPATYRTVADHRVIVLDAGLPGQPGARLVLRTSLTPLRLTLQQVATSLLTWALLGLVGGAALSAWLATRLTRPLERVVAVAESIRQGHLEQRVLESRESLEVNSLQQSLNQMLDRLQLSLTAQRQFVADASHELRSPIHGLQISLEVALRRQRSEAEYREVLGTALKETLRLGRLVQDLLLLSRHDLDRLELRRGPTRLDVVVEECLQAHQAVAEQNEVKLTVGECPPLTADVDPERLRQALDNLVDNALRHTPRTGRVEVALGSEGTEARLSVCDEGQALAPHEYLEIFERFARLDPSRQRTSGGLGLGLAITRALVQAHGGRVWGEAREVTGSRFVIALPEVLARA